MSDNKKVSGSMLALAIDKMLDLLDDKADQTEVEKKANASDLAAKQDKLTFDSTPTVNSANPVTSGGIKAALDNKADAKAVDTAITNAQNKADSAYTLAADAKAIGEAADEIARNGIIKVVNATSTDGVTYIATVPGITELTAGVQFVMIPNMDSTSDDVELNINGLGSTMVRVRRLTNSSSSIKALSSDWLKADYPVTMMFNGNWWVTTDFGYAHGEYIYGTVPVKSGGTGQVELTAGSYLVGNGTGNVQLKAPAEVRADIGAQPTVTGGATTITSSNLTASRALISDSNGKVAASAVTSTELGYLDGVTSAIQTQLDGKAASSHGTHVTFSTTVPVVAGTASVGSASTVSRSDHVHPAQTSVSGNAGTATKFASKQSVALTGDVTGSASSQAGWSVATTLASSGVTAGSYGPSANASPAAKGTFSVPYITVDAKGRVTAASTKTITLPADNDSTYTLSSITGTLAVSKGGTGAKTFTSGEALIGSGTKAVTTRTIRNNTATSGNIAADTALITSNTLKNAINRTTSVGAADTNYTTYMARGIALVSSETTPSVNGAIAFIYE